MCYLCTLWPWNKGAEEFAKFVITMNFEHDLMVYTKSRKVFTNKHAQCPLLLNWGC